MPMVPYTKCLAANTTAASFAARIPTATMPADGESALLDSRVFTPIERDSTVRIMPFAAGADDGTCQVRIIGWGRTEGSGALWMPVIICTATCTLCTAVGVAGKDVVATDRFCDAIVPVATTGGIAVTPGVTANTPAVLIVDISGYQKYELQFNINASATNVNALVAEFN